VAIVPNGYVETLVPDDVDPVDMTVTFVGQISGWAGAERILESARKNKEAEFLVIGGGRYLEEIKKIARDAGLNNLAFLGFRPIREVYRIISSSEIVISPLLNTVALEVACPIKLIEYLALGKPMVVEKVGELPVIFEKSGAALVVSSAPGALAEGINLLLTDGKMRKKMGKRAKRLSRSYSWRVQGERLVSVIRGD
jgi:glycosyltransferase involved in cell wall biosynthesis